MTRLQQAAERDLAASCKAYLEAFHWTLSDRGWTHPRLTPKQTVTTWDALAMTRANKLLAAYPDRMVK